ncbi:MAG: 2'-5' RNA ligase family protein [Ferruginibacter sp.]|nr:2'-5' RNA ligase family protein [Ferruginibacter sp.]
MNQPVAIKSSAHKIKSRDLSNTMVGYKINEYQLVLSPGEALRSKIQLAKQHFADSYHSSNALYSKPHIGLVNFVQYQMMESKLLSRLQTTAMGLAPIKVEMKDYGSFPAHTIYVNITSKLQVQHLVKTIRSDAQRLMKLNEENKPYFILEPYITIARKLDAQQFEKGWLEYSNLHFTGRFIADAMLLLKRPVGETKYEIVQRLEFKNMPVTTTQGDLFGI